MDNKKRLIIASLVAQTVKNLPARQETWVRSLGWEDLLEKGMAADSSILAWRIPWTEELGGYSPWGCKESDMTEWLTLPLFSSEIHTFTWQNVIFSEVLIIWWSTRWTNTQLFGKCGTQKPGPQMEADAGVLPLLLSELLGLRCFLLVLQPELMLSSLVSNQLYLSLTCL